MSKLTELISLLPKGIANADKILEGLLNEVKSIHGTLPEDELEEILRRRLICKGCPFLSPNAKTSQEYKELTGNHYKTKRISEHCSLCGCDKKLKTSSLESNCGIEAWNENNPDKKLELKWTSYKKQ